MKIGEVGILNRVPEEATLVNAGFSPRKPYPLPLVILFNLNKFLTLQKIPFRRIIRGKGKHTGKGYGCEFAVVYQKE